MATATALPPHPGADTLLDKIEDFFGHPDITTAVGTFLNTESKNFAHFVESDDPKVHENVALFRKYCSMIEQLMDRFCAEQQVELLSVAKACLAEIETCAGAPSSYICVSYIAAGVDMEHFTQLVAETNDIVHYDEMETYEAGEDDDEDEEDEDEQQQQLEGNQE